MMCLSRFLSANLGWFLKIVDPVKGICSEESSVGELSDTVPDMYIQRYIYNCMRQACRTVSTIGVLVLQRKE